MNTGMICVSVCAETADEMIANIKRAEEFADVVEVRFDCLEPDQIGHLKFQISKLKFDKALLATFRSPDQGGNGAATLCERVEFWNSIGDDFWAADLEEDVFQVASSSLKRIASLHDFNGVPASLGVIYERLLALGADMAKIAVAADDIVETIPVWKCLERSRSTGNEIIPIAMGEAGKWTRILGLAHGACLTYASLDDGAKTASGQLTGWDLIDVYRVKELDRDTRVFGVIGDPASQSLSPYMQNAAFAAAGENAVFMHLLVKNLNEFMRRMVRKETREVDLNLGGFSVTMPHKRAIIKHLDAVDPVAEQIGAVNTVKIEGRRLIGYNTDAHGFITPLKAHFGELRGSRVAVFGAGGAARACVYALKNEGANVSVFVRDPERAGAFAKEFDVELKQLASAPGQLPADFDIIVNATPIGMKGALEGETLFTADQLLGVRFVYDLVTTPTDTPLQSEAKKAGIPAIGGIEMLIAQGARQFELWTERQAPLDLMRAAVLARMNR